MPWGEALRSSVVAGNTGVMTLGIGIQLILQALYFVLVTRTMGASAYGAFVGIAALAGIIGAFSGWGGDQLLIRRVANAPGEFPQALGNALAFFAVSAPIFIVFAFIAIPLLMRTAVPWPAVILIVLSDILFARANNFAINCFQAFERGRDMARLGILLNLAKAIGAVIWRLTTSDPSVTSWAWYYFVASLIAGSVGMAQVFVYLGRPVWQVRWRDWRDGGFFALQMGSFLGFRDIDKPVVLTLSSFHQAGLYAAAFRIADVAAVPVRALMYSTYTRFFQHGARGTRGSLAFARKLLPVGIALGGMAGIAVAVSSSFAPLILGPATYGGMGPVLLILAPLPFLYALYYIGADALVSGGHVGFRTLFQLLLPALDLTLCAVFVPRYGAIGAAFAAVLTHLALVILVWTAAALIVRRMPAESPS